MTILLLSSVLAVLAIAVAVVPAVVLLTAEARNARRAPARITELSWAEREQRRAA